MGVPHSVAGDNNVQVVQLCNKNYVRINFSYLYFILYIIYSKLEVGLLVGLKGSNGPLSWLQFAMVPMEKKKLSKACCHGDGDMACTACHCEAFPFTVPHPGPPQWTPRDPDHYAARAQALSYPVPAGPGSPLGLALGFGPHQIITFIVTM